VAALAKAGKTEIPVRPSVLARNISNDHHDGQQVPLISGVTYDNFVTAQRNHLSERRHHFASDAVHHLRWPGGNDHAARKSPRCRIQREFCDGNMAPTPRDERIGAHHQHPLGRTTVADRGRTGNGVIGRHDAESAVRREQGADPGDSPLLGALFRHSSTTCQDRVVDLHDPDIVRDPGDLAPVTQLKRPG